MSRLFAVCVWAALILLIVLVLVFAGLRVAVDTPMLLSGSRPDPDAFEAKYVQHPFLAYAHIVPGVVYLVGAPLQMCRPFRNRHIAVHRKMGRMVLASGLISGVFALGFGIPFPTGGAWQAAATALFGSYFLVALAVAYRYIRRGDVSSHRRWMLRAFTVGLGVGTIRIWVGFLAGLGPLDLAEAFAPAFWLAFTMHAIVAEVWLYWRPSASGRRQSEQIPVAS